MKQVPNIFTLLNLVFGSMAIIFILQTGESIVYVDGQGFPNVSLPEKITWGALCIFAAAIVDFLDGFVARLFKATSEMGKQLDSLSDLVSFGVAPGMIMYQLLRMSFAQQVDGLDVSIIWLLPALIVPCAAAWRLAKFNLDAEQAFAFKGIPSPAAGLVVASLPLIMFYQQMNLQDILLNKWLLYGIILLLSYGMVSNLPLLSLKFKSSGGKDNLPKYILVAIAIVAAVTVKWIAVPVILLAYVLVSLIFKNKTA
jgi:CDP-diacylglycerol--serine O-phosphatidyltransferase